jgi:hypothetical protein
MNGKKFASRLSLKSSASGCHLPPRGVFTGPSCHAESERNSHEWGKYGRRVHHGSPDDAAGTGESGINAQADLQQFLGPLHGEPHVINPIHIPKFVTQPLDGRDQAIIDEQHQIVRLQAAPLGR